MNLMRMLLALLTPTTLSFGGGGSPPPPAPISAEEQKKLVPPMLQSPQGAEAADELRKRAAGGKGYGGTIVTGPMGLTEPPNTTQKQLTGQ